MTTESVQRAIDQYHSEGLSFFPIPARSKEAAIPWKVYQERQPTEDEIIHWKNNGTSNLAVVCGAVSGNLVVPDFDDHEKWYEYLDYTKDKLNLDMFTFTRLVRTSKGIHVWLRLPQTIKSLKFPKLDIKAEGGYVMAPPSIHPSGALYEIINPGVPIRTINSLEDIGIDTTQRPVNEQENLGRAGETIPPGTQDAWLFSRACGYRAKGDDVDTLIDKLRIDIKRCPQAQGKRPYDDVDFKRLAESACKYPPGTMDINTHMFNTHDNAKNNSKTGQMRDKSGTNAGQTTDKETHQKLSVSFDTVLKEAGKMSKRDIAGTIGVQATNDSFRKLVQRRVKDGQARYYRGSSEILEWVNKEYKVLTLADYRKVANLSVKLPLDLNKKVNVPPGSVIGVAGYTSAGKTSFLMEICELNTCTQDLPVYYWFNEMSEERMLLRLDDYPLLMDQMGAQFKAVKQTDFEFYDVIEPDAINVIDYLDLDGDGDQQVYMIGAVIKKLQRKLGMGIVIYALQKQENKDMGYGGVFSAKLSNLYLSLDTVSQNDTSMIGKCKIVKAKDWGGVNPVGLYCNYYTGGKHGKIMSDNLWRRETK